MKMKKKRTKLIGWFLDEQSAKHRVVRSLNPACLLFPQLNSFMERSAPAASAMKRKSAKWELPPEHKGRVRRTRRPRYDVQAQDYTCGPIALRNAWTWQHAMTTNPLEPLPLTHGELIAKCKCTKEEGTEHHNLYTDFLRGNIKMVVPATLRATNKRPCISAARARMLATPRPWVVDPQGVPPP